MVDETAARYEPGPAFFNPPEVQGEVLGWASDKLRTDVVYGSTKTYAANVGLSAAFRQHPADSHCNQLHGYALEVSACFEADSLDHRNWVIDFGGLKDFKRWLES